MGSCQLGLDSYDRGNASGNCACPQSPSIDMHKLSPNAPFKTVRAIVALYSVLPIQASRLLWDSSFLIHSLF